MTAEELLRRVLACPVTYRGVRAKGDRVEPYTAMRIPNDLLDEIRKVT